MLSSESQNFILTHERRHIPGNRQRRVRDSLRTRRNAQSSKIHCRLITILTYARRKKRTLAKPRQIDMQTTVAFQSDSGLVKLGVTPVGGWRAGDGVGVDAIARRVQKETNMELKEAGGIPPKLVIRQGRWWGVIRKIQ